MTFPDFPQPLRVPPPPYPTCRAVPTYVQAVFAATNRPGAGAEHAPQGATNAPCPDEPSNAEQHPEFSHRQLPKAAIPPCANAPAGDVLKAAPQQKSPTKRAASPSWRSTLLPAARKAGRPPITGYKQPSRQTYVADWHA